MAGWLGDPPRSVLHREDARLYTPPAEPPPIYVSGFGTEATALAASIGDGYVNTCPAGSSSSSTPRPGPGPKLAAVKICYGPDEAAARKLAHQRWRTSGVAGQLNQELALPSHFEAASQLVTEDVVAESITCGPDPDRHVEAIQKYIDAGYDEIYIAQVGDDQEGFLKFFAKELKPRLPHNATTGRWAHFGRRLPGPSTDEPRRFRCVIRI